MGGSSCTLLRELVVVLYTSVRAGVARAVRVCGRGAEAAGAFPMGALLDHWSSAFIGLLCVVSVGVYRWSYYYMESDPVYRRFLGLLTTFVGSMVALVLSGTLFASLVG